MKQGANPALRTHRDIQTAREYAAWTTRRFFVSVLLLAVCWVLSGWLEARAWDAALVFAEPHTWHCHVYVGEGDGQRHVVSRSFGFASRKLPRAAHLSFQFFEHSKGPGEKLGLIHGGTVESHLGIGRSAVDTTRIPPQELAKIERRVLASKFPPKALEMYRAGVAQTEEFSLSGTVWMLLEGGSRLLFWIAIALCAGRFWLVLRRTDRAIGHRCVRCNYSRRGLKNAPCPECGLMEQHT